MPLIPQVNSLSTSDAPINALLNCFQSDPSALFAPKLNSKAMQANRDTRRTCGERCLEKRQSRELVRRPH